jgi:chromosome segregation ATPase
MNLQQRQSSPAEPDDLEVTAELPVLDVAAYEANAAATSTTGTYSQVAPERDPLNSTDTWHIPAPSLRGSKTAATDAANTIIDENRAKLETNLHSLSTTLRDVEDRLTRKSERLAEMEKSLELAVAERGTTEQRARALSDELTRAEAASTAAQARIVELQKALQETQAAEEARRARDTEVQAQLNERNKQIQAQLVSAGREFEAKLAASHHDFDTRFATHAQSMARFERELTDARDRNTEYLEALQSNEGRRSVFEDLINTLEDDVAQRDARIADLEKNLTRHTGHEGELESELRERIARIAALDKQASALTAALAQRTEQQTDGERTRAGLQQSVSALNGTLAERNDRVKVLEGTVEQQTFAAAQLRGELERAAAERTQLVAGAASLEAALKAATARGDQQESVARAAQSRIDQYEAVAPAQRRRLEQLETEVAAVRAELQSSSSSLQTAGVERNEHMARIAAGEARLHELEARTAEQQETVRQLQAESNAHMARAKELESAHESRVKELESAHASRVKELENHLHAAEESINRLEGEARNKGVRVDELEKINNDWRATVEEARHAISDRDVLIERLEQETAASAVLVGHIQKSITRLDSDAPPRVSEPSADGATRLLIRTDGESEVVHVLGRKTTVGRTPENDLQIDAKFISRHHAVILAGPAHAIIEDLNSTNGVMVNNRRITRQPLKDGDNVVIGKTSFRFVVRPARNQSQANN